MAKSLHCFGEKCSCNLVLDFSYTVQSVSSMPSGLPGSGRVSCRSSTSVPAYINSAILAISGVLLGSHPLYLRSLSNRSNHFSHRFLRSNRSP